MRFRIKQYAAILLRRGLRVLLVASSPLPLVICGPSGVGKGTLLEHLMKVMPQFTFSVSHTTRAPRPGEEDGVHYNFSTVEKVKAMISNGEFLEWAEVHGNYYGTSLEGLRGKGVTVLDIDVQGVKNVKRAVAEGRLAGANYVFIRPVNVAGLEERLRGRGTETEEKILLRVANATSELEYGEEAGNFDVIITNNDLNKAKMEIVEVVKSLYRL
jgi:guanylate kinase